MILFVFHSEEGEYSAMCFFIMFFISLLSAGVFGGNSEASATLPKDPIAEKPVSMVIPRDLPFLPAQKEMEARGLRIIALGDSGTGSPDQMKVARAIEKFCAEKGCDLGILLGDNFQPAGVQSVEDPQFIEKFEKPYANLGIPFFAILGAHDWGRKGAMYNWKAQIEYTGRSKSWVMPSDVYSVTWADLKLIALNTNSFPRSTIQKEWLLKELENSPVHWNLVMGHEHIHAYGYHGDTDFLVRDVLPLLCGRADLYLSSHEHSLQVLKADCGLPLVVSGAAGTVRPVKDQGPRALFVSSELGFAYLQVKKEELIIQIISVDENVRFALTIPKGKLQKQTNR
jgi:tartrate-resistant acid phosphatase type 5